MLLFFTGISLLFAEVQGIFPMFGTMMFGGSARVLVAVTSLLYLLAAWQCYRLRVAGWWLALILIIGFSISATLTLGRVSMVEIYRKSGFPEQQIQLASQMKILNSPRYMIPWLVMLALGAVGYTISVRRYFVSGAQTDAAQ
jgi:hypothetical protein